MDIAQLTDSLASAIVQADPTDLQGLAAMHTHCEQIAAGVGEVANLAADAAANLKQSATTAGQLIEKIVLREVDDVAGTLRSISDQIAALQAIVRQTTGNSDEAYVPGAMPAGSIPTEPTPTAATAGGTNAADEFANLTFDDEPIFTADDLQLVNDFTTEATQHIENAEAELLKLGDDPGNLETVNAVFRAFHTIKGVAGFLNIRQIGKLAHQAENLLDLARQGQLAMSEGIVDLVLESNDMMKGFIAALAATAPNAQRLPVEPRLPDLLRRLAAAAAGEAAEPAAPQAAPAAQAAAPAEAAPAAAEPESTPAKSEDAAPAKTDAPAAAKAGNNSTAESTVKVATDRLDSLINMVGELVIAQSMVRQDVADQLASNQRLARNVGHLGKIARELQELSMSMRMVPIQGVFQKMTRLTRDLAKKFGKEIEMTITGGETELDRNVVEAISDPLVHMVRNSLDHGVEKPDERVASGKPRQGNVELKAYHEAGNIVIEIIDDGKGINKARVLKKAIANGIVREDQTLSEQDIFKLIFAPGLSTAEKITDVSGRGVGMDVVKKNVEALRGRIDIASTEGKGSTFAIRLPLTLAVIDGLVVKVGSERYIIPINSIEQSIQPTNEMISTVQGRAELVMIRGHLLPMVRLHSLFSVDGAKQDPTKALLVIVQDNQRRCGVVVDDLLGQQQVVIKSLGDGLGSIRGVSGGAILGDGNISLILDVPGLIELAHE